MSDASHPLSLRLSPEDFARLTEQAQRASSTPSAMARNFIRAGLKEPDADGQSKRLLSIERRIATLAQTLEDLAATTKSSATTVRGLDAMFETLLQALSGQQPTPKR